MTTLNGLYFKDLAERVGWTAAEAAVAVVAVEAGDWPLWIAVPVATGLAAVKGFIAKHVGRSESASTVPSV